MKVGSYYRDQFGKAWKVLDDNGPGAPYGFPYVATRCGEVNTTEWFSRDRRALASEAKLLVLHMVGA